MGRGRKEMGERDSTATGEGWPEEERQHREEQRKEEGTKEEEKGGCRGGVCRCRRRGEVTGGQTRRLPARAPEDRPPKPTGAATPPRGHRQSAAHAPAPAPPRVSPPCTAAQAALRRPPPHKPPTLRGRLARLADRPRHHRASAADPVTAVPDLPPPGRDPSPSPLLAAGENLHLPYA